MTVAAIMPRSPWRGGLAWRVIQSVVWSLVITGIQPGLTPLAAVGLTTLMSLASIFHFGRGEFGYLVVTAPLALACAFIAWGRLTRDSIRERLGG